MGELRAEDLGPKIETTTLYQQVAGVIRTAIANKHLVSGDTLPSEPEIADQLGVSRNIVRRALDDLAGAGLIVKRPGAATKIA